MSQPSPSHSTIGVSLRHHSGSSRFSVSHCVLHDHLILIQNRKHIGSAQHCFQRKIHCNYPPTKDPEPSRFDQLQHKLPTNNHSTTIINSSTEHAILLWIHLQLRDNNQYGTPSGTRWCGSLLNHQRTDQSLVARSLMHHAFECVTEPFDEEKLICKKCNLTRFMMLSTVSTTRFHKDRSLSDDTIISNP